MRFLTSLILGLFIALPSFAQDDDRAAQIVRAWSDWATAGGTTETTIVVMRAGEIVAQSSIGTAQDAAMPIASLSKALTAQCIAKLSETNVLSMDMTLGDILDVPDTLTAVTLEQLITHTSGIWPDSTQNNLDLNNAATDQTQAISQVSIDRDVQMGTVGAYAYNNENYAILGAVVEQVSGGSYQQACHDAVFGTSRGRTATIGGEWAAHGAWGGWSISAADYARFAWDMFGPESEIGARPQGWPTTQLDGGANYGMGVLWREIRGRHLFWSTGMLCWDGAGDGGYFASYGGEYLVVTLYSDCLDGTQRLGDLDSALFAAAVL